MCSAITTAARDRGPGDGGTRANLPGEAALEFPKDAALLVVSVNRSYPRLSAYEAARYAWRVSPARARQVELVIATKNRRIVGVFEPTEWKPATRENFPEFERAMPGRIGFVGRPAPAEVEIQYMGQILPREFAFSGNGYRYAGSLGL